MALKVCPLPGDRQTDVYGKNSPGVCSLAAKNPPMPSCRPQNQSTRMFPIGPQLTFSPAPPERPSAEISLSSSLCPGGATRPNPSQTKLCGLTEAFTPRQHCLLEPQGPQPTSGSSQGWPSIPDAGVHPLEALRCTENFNPGSKSPSGSREGSPRQMLEK